VWVGGPRLRRNLKRSRDQVLQEERIPSLMNHLEFFRHEEADRAHFVCPTQSCRQEIKSWRRHGKEARATLISTRGLMFLCRATTGFYPERSRRAPTHFRVHRIGCGKQYTERGAFKRPHEYTFNNFSTASRRRLSLSFPRQSTQSCKRPAMYWMSHSSL
jgi:hypothetical protein